ncbi:MAG TPA: carboxypeptidase-like regulatory domain-containing protein [Chitinophagaceae bacterium]|nr:carboxypeptidase-like regulatory domain-containing protein [Chitinophagaceae bacterium]
MKSKLFLILLIALLGSGLVRASETEPGDGSGKKYDLNGSVVQGESKKPIKNVNVTAYLSSKKEKVVITDGNGNYAFDDLKPGTYKFVFEKDGFRKVVREKVVIKTDEAFQLNIEMIENNDFDLVPTPFHFTDL